MTTERRYTPEEVQALLDATHTCSAEWEELKRVWPMQVAAYQWEQVRQKAAALKASQEQEPLPAIRVTHYATATALEALEREREAQWAAQQGADEAAYEASVQHRLSDLRHEGTWWTYGHVDPLHADDERQGYGCWLECTIGRESDTGVWLTEPDWHSWEGAADEAAARTEATRRNRGEQA